MRRALAALVAVAAAMALAGCGTQTQAQALRGWMSNANFTANSATLRLDISHVMTALEDASAPATELHTVCGILTTDAEAANSALPTPNRVAATELSVAYEEMGTAANTCYYAAGNAAQRRVGIIQLAAAGQDLTLATWQLQVAAGDLTDAAATAAWAKETKFARVVAATDVYIATTLRQLHSSATPAADGAYCRAHGADTGLAASLLPAPDAQASSEIAAALDALDRSVGTCASVTAAMTGPTRPVIASVIASLTRVGPDLYFAAQRVTIASQP